MFFRDVFLEVLNVKLGPLNVAMTFQKSSIVLKPPKFPLTVVYSYLLVGTDDAYNTLYSWPFNMYNATCFFILTFQ